MEPEKAGIEVLEIKPEEIEEEMKEIETEGGGITGTEILEGAERVLEGEKAEDESKYTQTIRWGIHNINVRQEGKGFWGERVKQKNNRVDNFELKINPNNESYYLLHPDGGYVQFENVINSTVQDGKLIMSKKSFYHVDEMPPFAKMKVLKEAQRQISASTKAGYNIEWLVSDENAIAQLEKFFKEQSVDVKLTYYPE